MDPRFPYPASFPDQAEVAFLTMVLSDDATFPDLFDRWNRETILDDIDYATMRLLPLVYLRASVLGIHGPTFGRLQGIYKLAWVQNQRLLDALDRVAARFAELGIRMLTLKGVPLLALAYKNAGARFLGDADVLIDRRDIRRALSAMRSDGWKIATAFFPHPESFGDESLARITKEACFKDGRGIEIDVHWRLFDPTGDDEAVPFERWWAESAPFAIRGREYRSLPTEDMLLNVIVHGSVSNAHRTLRWVTDAVAITRSFPVDWERFVRLAKMNGRTAEVYAALTFLLEHGFVPGSQEVRRLLSECPPSAEEWRTYCVRSNGVHDAFEGFLVLWRAYWRHEAKGVPPASVWGFVGYVQRARGLASTRELAKFVWGWCTTTAWK